MKKTLNKVLCVFLSVLMLMSSMVAIASAADEFAYGAKFYAQRSDAANVAACLDKADEALGSMNPKIYYEMDLKVTKFTVDVTSINALCKTLDSFKKLPLDNFIVKGLLKDIGNIDLSNWPSGLKRSSTNDTKIVSGLLQILSDNRKTIAKLADNSLDIGVAGDYVDTNFLGEDGLSGMVTGLIVGLVYSDKNSDNYKKAYSKAKTDLDSFLYDTLIPELLAGEDDILPGFKMNATSTVDDLLHSVFDICWKKYLAPMIKGINVDVNTIENDDLKKLANVADLDCSDFDTNIKVDSNKTFLEQINDIVGFIATQFLKDKSGFTWVSGSYDKIGTNVTNLLRYLAEKSGLVANASKMTYDELVLKIFGVILNNVDLGNYGVGLGDCKSIEEIARAVLINTAAENNIGTTYTAKASYLVVAGDILAWWANKYMDLADLNGKAYKQGGGADVYTVANYIVNYYLINKGGANALGLSVKNTDSIFTKIDKIVDMLASDGSMNFSSETFIKTLVDDVLKLDIQGIVNITIVDALKAAEGVSGVEMVYKAVTNLVNNWLGTSTNKILTPYQKTKPFTNLISNASLKTTIQNLLYYLNKSKTKILPSAYYIIGILVNLDKKFSLDKVTVPDQAYTGKAVMPTGVTVTVKDANGKVETLTQGKDFEVTSTDVDFGDATATVAVEGKYAGTVTAPFKIVFGKVGKVSASVKTTSATLTWDEVAGAASYTVYKNVDSKLTEVAKVTTPKYTVTGLTAGAAYNYSVCATSATYGTTAKSNVKFVTAPNTPAQVTGVKVYSAKENAITVQWTKVAGATGYEVYQYISSKWVKVATTTTKTYATISGLKAFTSYKFSVKAYATNADKSLTAYGKVSATLTATTLLGQVQGLTYSSSSSTALKLAWTKVSGATAYEVYSVSGSTVKKIATVTTNSYSISKLKAGTVYSYKVRAYSKTTKAYGAYSATVKALTGAKAVTGVKASSATSTTLKLSWTKVSGATGYEVYVQSGSSWKKVATATTNSVTLKSLKGNTTYKYKVRSYRKYGSVISYGDFSAIVSATTNVAKVTGLKGSSITKSSVKLTWTKVSGATGYVVYRNGKAVKTITKGTTVTFTDSKLSRSTTYKYTVKAYKTVSKKNVYGDVSATLKVTTKIF